MLFPLPTALHLYSAGIAQVLNRRLLKKSQPAKKIHEYILMKEIARSDAMPNFTFGVYRKKGNKFFIKTWHGGLPDINYYFLRNEVNMSRVLSKHTTKTITTPSLVEIIHEKNKLSVVYAFVDAKAGDKYGIAAQAKMLNQVEKWLNTVSSVLSPQERSSIPSRPLASYLGLLPVIAAGLIIKKPRSFISIIKSTIQCARVLHKQRKSHLVLSHRDLTPDNLRVKGKRIFVMDIESIAYTLPGYDSAFVAIHESEDLNVQLKKLFNWAPNLGLQIYLLLHHAIFSGDFLHVHSENLLRLNQLIS